jgi:hypothetical protein
MLEIAPILLPTKYELVINVKTRQAAVGDESVSTSLSPKLVHRSEPPGFLHRKLRANLVRHDSKIWRRHGQVDVEVGAHSENC